MERKPQSSSDRARFDYDRAYDDAANLRKTKESRTAAARQTQQMAKNSSRSGTGRPGTAQSGTAGTRPSKSGASRSKSRKARARRKKRIRMIVIAAICLVLIIAVAVLLIRCGKTKESKEEETTEKVIEVLDIQSETVSIDKIYTYGTHLNMTGTLPEEILNKGYNIDLVLYNGEFRSVPVEITGDTFTLSEYANGGLYLDDIERDDYTMFIRVASTQSFEPETEAETESETQTVEDGEEETTKKTGIQKKKPDETTEAAADGEAEEEGETEEITWYYQYYALKNTTDYQETTYYTMSRYDNCVVIDNESTYPTMQMSVSENTSGDVYDIVLDAGHGGIDGGAQGYDDYCERDFTLKLVLKIKALLEDKGFTVALTRDNDDETLYPYGDDGRIARVCNKNAKFMFSVHMNSTGTGGLEIYTANNIDYTFAKLLRDNIQSATGLTDTANMGSMVEQNIFSRVFSQTDVDEVIADNTADGLTPYDPQVGCSYYFVIRETGGIITGAYTDDRNPEEDYNPYCYDNTCSESYITELGYINVEEDVKLMLNNMDDYAKAIADSIGTLDGSESSSSAETADAQTPDADEADDTADGTAEADEDAAETIEK